MIELTRLNGHSITLNSDLIRFIEATPDTTITLLTGEKLIVLEDATQVAQRIQSWRAETLRCAWPDALTTLTAALSATVRPAA